MYECGCAKTPKSLDEAYRVKCETEACESPIVEALSDLSRYQGNLFEAILKLEKKLQPVLTPCNVKTGLLHDPEKEKCVPAERVKSELAHDIRVKCSFTVDLEGKIWNIIDRLEL